jgi:general secretion pathway protein G
MRAFVAAVVVMIGLGLPHSYSQTQDPAAYDRVLRAKRDVETIAVQLKLYQALNGFLPTTAQGLQALVTAPEPKPAGWHPLMDAVPLDPWGNPYRYKAPGVHNPGSYDLYSAGPDGKADTGDDIGNW